MSDALPSSNPMNVKDFGSDTKVVVDALLKFYELVDIMLKTDINEEERACILAINAVDKIILNDWNIDMEYDDDITIPFMALALSISRKGRGETMEVMKFQLAEKRENDKLKRLFGDRE